MENLLQHFLKQPTFLVVFIVICVLIIASITYFLNQKKRYGLYFDFASQSRKIIAGLSLTGLVALFIYGLTPYVSSVSDEIVIVIGNTQNTPTPKLSSEITDAITEIMLMHKGEDVSVLVDSIKIVSAVKNPEVIKLDSAKLGLSEIGNNNSNAKRSAQVNIKAIEEAITSLTPTDNGANYMEAIFEARDNAKVGSKIFVIGSGLSDSGELDFSKSNILTNEGSRKDAIEEIKNKYGRNYLDNYMIEFYGLGDSVPPQEDLSNIQKSLVRDIYSSTIRSLGGDVKINTETLVGSSVITNFVVGTTDTGCGEIGLIFNDDNLKFENNQAKFINHTIAKDSLTIISKIWSKYEGSIELIQIDGFIAHYAGPDVLSQQRADLVKQILVELGIPADKLNATGRGFGPNKLDMQNRIVKVTISRNNEQCEN